MASNFPTGLDNFPNPTDTTVLDTPGLTHVDQHTNINDSVENIEAKLGVNFSSVTTSIDYIVKLLLLTQTVSPDGAYAEIERVPSKIWISSITWYTDSGKTTKLVDKTFTYGGAAPVPTVITMRMFDGTPSNNVVRTVTDTVTYNRIFEQSRVRSIG